ncbi:ABC transporter ATP-binding protein [Bacteroides sp. 224]|uniref:ABC transporter ATP-binding protein n=1 Tax=Bacteroides sp. 224 TaxID=2302936 RepID=UPI0013D8D209|nr:ABC transporter ATP-binding protein [Bacteroides sp. 224]NDV67045.1 ABC transporter ATP-binding protein [Bacteroides sp. 224]
MDTIIQCDNITHYYGRKLIYKNLNFEVKKGKILGLLGKNGTGKTTIINILNGYLKPQSGICRIFGEDMENFTPATKARIGLLLEGHIQHTYFNIEQIERFYSRFFPNWKRDAYYELLKKLQVTRTQKISTMSCGQRSQIALGLLFAQDPELLILDDFSMGLDPGYRRLFVEYLKEYATAENKTIFLTSHIIQDMEMLIDDCMILDYGRILLHKPTKHIVDNFKRYRFTSESCSIKENENLWNTEKIGNNWETYSFQPKEEVEQLLSPYSISNLKEEEISLEDAFIGLTGKY